ncbi:cubilin-like isoform X2 [Antedon mediterranea]|uniref:cubilin-like isoform X2 n=1 Tax=Antedon mediterranea TaxID=105859 RepID=UPI003AF446F7
MMGNSQLLSAVIFSVTFFVFAFAKPKGYDVETRQNEDGVVIIPANCDRQLESETGCITSPNWPRKSVDFNECQIRVKIPDPNKRILLTFNNFTLEGTTSCDHGNYVEIRDTKTNRQNRYCGTSYPFTWLTDSNELSVTMNALSSKVFNRFNATYITLEKAPSNGCSFVLVNEIGRYSSSTEVHVKTPWSCEAVILAHPNERVLVSFKDLYIPNCDHKIEMRDLLTGRSKAVCGKHAFVSWTSDSNQVAITFDRSDSRTSVLFEYEFLLRSRNESCSPLVVGLPADGLRLTSPLFPRPYPSNLDCQIILHTDFNQVISLNFSEFTLEPATETNKIDSCVNDYLQIRDIATERISRLCGSYHNFSWTSHSNEVVLTLRTNHLLDYIGYSLIAKSLFRLSNPDCVTITQTADNGYVLTSLNYPDEYSMDASCTVFFQEYPNRYIIFDFEDFDVEDSEDCTNDYLELTSSTSGPLCARLCGKKEPFSVTSDSNEVSITFKTNSKIQKSGFKAYCSIVNRPPRTLENTECSTILREKSGRIQLPTNPDWPPIRGSDCLIVIHAEPDERIRLNFIDFVVSDLDSDRDFVELYDISLSGKTNKATYSGHLHPFSWTSFRNELVIYVRDENEISSVSFIADYEILPRSEDGCELLFTNPTGIISWPFDGESKAEHCTVIIRTDPDKRVLITFKTVRMDMADCSQHSMTIKDTTTKRQSQYCSTLWEFSWLSDSDEVEMEFTHQLTNFAQVQAMYGVIPRTRIAAFNQFLTAPEGIISSLEHNRDEIIGKNCTIFIQVEPENSVVVTLTDFLIGDEQAENTATITCTGQQFLEIKDLTTGRTNVYCGEFDLFTWTSDFNLVAITFHITTYPTYNVFRAVYRSLQQIEGCDNRLTAPTGIIESPQPYNPNTNCRNIVHSEPGNLVTLTFTNFEMQPCETDHVKLIDLGTLRTEVFCGSFDLFSWTSDTNEVSVYFVSGPKYMRNTGFKTEYRHVQRPLVNECYLRKHDTTELVTLPDFTIKDVENAECIIYVYNTPDNRIQFTVEEFDEVFNCSDSGIELTDVATERTNTYCTISHSFSWTADTNEIKIRVFAKKDKLPRMIAKWKSVARIGEPVISLEDSGHIKLTSTFPTYQYLIHVEPNYRLIINYMHEHDAIQHCNIDSIKITDSTTLRFFQDCTFFDGIMSWVSDSNEVIIDAKQIAGHDTVLYYTRVLKAPPSECNKVITSDTNLETNSGLETANYPGMYPNELVCDMIMQTTSDNRIQVVFKEFWLEIPNHMGCHNDYLNVSDTSVGFHYDHSERICGRLEPISWTSEGNSLLLRLQTDKTIARTGYIATYTILKRPQPAPHCNKTYLGPNGVISSPNFAVGLPQYSNDLLCYYFIKGNVLERILVHFVIFDVELQTPCQPDYVQIEDVATRKTNIICGEHPNYIWESESNEVNITFITDGSRTFRGFNATYTMEHKQGISYCDETLTDTTGTFHSPDFPAKYPNDLNCVYTIIADPGHFIEVIFEFFQLETSPHCTNDYVSLSNVGEGTSQRYCDKHNLLKWNSTTNSATVTLHSDHVITDNGFKATYKIHQVFQPETCSPIHLTTSSGMFQSPNYPSNYENNLECTYRITVNPSRVIRIEFIEFEIEEPQSGFCADYLQIPYATQNLKLCGNLEKNVYITDSNDVLLTLITDGSNTLKGFKAMYTSVTMSDTPVTVAPTQLPFCSVEASRLTGSYDIIHSLNFPAYYPNNVKCRTIIETKKNTRIIITIRFMDIENYKLCDWDYLQIFDDVSGRSTEKLCGSLDAPFVWESDGNLVTMIFKSDDILARTGYYGTYQSVEIVAPTPFKKPGSKPKPDKNSYIGFGR